VSGSDILRVPRGYNPLPMKLRRLSSAALAILVAAASCAAAAQGFSSVSSGKRMPDSPPPPAVTVQVPQGTPAEQEPGAAIAAPQQPSAEATPPRDAAVTVAPPPQDAAVAVAPPPFSSGAPAVAPSATAAPAAPQGCEAPNPFLTGSAAAAAEKACVLANSFMTGSAAGTTPEPADRVLVKKSERRLYLMRADRIIADYPVKLGLSPKGPKEREGDFRTPEGIYELTRRNQYSDFFLSLELSYPNEADRQRARAFGFKPGGLIMIHGQPNTPRRPPDYYANNDWTDGCIAVSNADMVEIWLRTTVGTPVEIRP